MCLCLFIWRFNDKYYIEIRLFTGQICSIYEGNTKTKRVIYESMEIHISNPVTFWQNVNIPFFRYSSFHLFIRISLKYMLKFVCSQEKQDIIRPRREPPELPEKVWKYTYLLIFYMMKIKCISTFFSRHLPQCSWIVKILLVRGDVISCVTILRHYNAFYLWGVN